MKNTLSSLGCQVPLTNIKVLSLKIINEHYDITPCHAGPFYAWELLDLNQSKVLFFHGKLKKKSYSCWLTLPGVCTSRSINPPLRTLSLPNFFTNNLSFLASVGIVVMLVHHKRPVRGQIHTTVPTCT